MSDAVNHPTHYNNHPSGVEAIDICERLPFNIGNAFKYIYRCDSKGSTVQDIDKAIFYVNRELENEWQPHFDNHVHCHHIYKFTMIIEKIIMAENDNEKKNFYISLSNWIGPYYDMNYIDSKNELQNMIYILEILRKNVYENCKA